MANGFLLYSYAFAASSPMPPEPGTNAAYLGNDYMGMVLRIPENSVMILDIDLGSPQPVDTVAVLGVNRTSADGWYIVAGNSFASGDFDTGSLADPGMLTNVRTARRTLLWTHETQVTARWWRIVIPAAVGIQTEAARVLIGQRQQYQRNFSYGVVRGAEDLGDLEFSPRGARLVRSGRVLRTLGLSWQALSPLDAELLSLRLLELIGNTRPVAACLNPEAGVYQSERFYYGYLSGDLSLTWRNHNMWEKRLQMKSVI